MKFYGKVGYTATVETAPGVWTPNVTEVSYYGDVLRNTRQESDGAKVNDDLSVDVSISIVADAYGTQNFMKMKYIEWAGNKWCVTQVDAQTSPRLILKLGGVYNGPTP